MALNEDRLCNCWMQLSELSIQDKEAREKQETGDKAEKVRATATVCYVMYSIIGD